MGRLVRTVGGLRDRERDEGDAGQFDGAGEGRYKGTKGGGQPEKSVRLTCDGGTGSHLRRRLRSVACAAAAECRQQQANKASTTHNDDAAGMMVVFAASGASERLLGRPMGNNAAANTSARAIRWCVVGRPLTSLPSLGWRGRSRIRTPDLSSQDKKKGYLSVPLIRDATHILMITLFAFYISSTSKLRGRNSLV